MHEKALCASCGRKAKRLSGAYFVYWKCWAHPNTVFAVLQYKHGLLSGIRKADSRGRPIFGSTFLGLWTGKDVLYS